MDVMQKNESKLELTTGKASGVTRVSRTCLYRYVKDFIKFFSPGASQHKRGRRWTLSDIEVVLSIRFLKHERRGNQVIGDALAAGWRSYSDPGYYRQERGRILDSVMEIIDGANQNIRESEKFVKDAEWHRTVTLEDHNEVVRLTQRVAEFEQVLDILMGHWKVKEWVANEKKYQKNTGRAHRWTW
jgi:hypothetical protein